MKLPWGAARRRQAEAVAAADKAWQDALAARAETAETLLEDQRASYADAIATAKKEAEFFRQHAQEAVARAEAAEREAAARPERSAAGYLVARKPEESWDEYRARVRDIFASGRESPLFRAILDEIGRIERRLFAELLGEEDPAKAERMRQEAAAHRALRVHLWDCAFAKETAKAREAARARVQPEDEWGLSDMDNQILGGAT